MPPVPFTPEAWAAFTVIVGGGLAAVLLYYAFDRVTRLRYGHLYSRRP